MAGLQAKYLSEATLFGPASDAWAISRGFLDINKNSLALLGTGNLSELTDTAAARVNIGLELGVDVQIHSQSLDRLAAITPSNFALNLLTKASSAEWTAILNDLSSSGAVTSVAMTGGITGLTISGGPITSTGTLTLGGTLGVASGGTGVTTLAALKSAMALQNVTNVALPAPVANQMISWNGTGTALVGVDAPVIGATTGLIAASSFTMNTARLLGRGTVSVGGIEELTIGSGLAVGGGALTATGLMATTTTAAAGRTVLGATTVGGNLFVLPNPSATSFLRINADNSVSALTASAFRTAAGAGDLLSTNNLSDVPNKATARTNLGLATVAATGSYSDLTGTPTAYTDENAQDAVAAMLAAGTHSNLSVTYNDVANSMNLAVTGIPAAYTDELAQDAIAAMLNAGTHSNITVSYNDTGNAMSLTVPPIPTQYTDELAQDAVAAALAAGTHSNISVAYNDGGNAISLTGSAPYTDENAQDAVANMFAAGSHTNITVTYNDVANSMSLAVSTASAYSDENAQDAIAAMLAAGTHTNISVSYNDAGNAMSLTVPAIPTQYTDELAQDAVATMLAAGTHSNITVTYNDAANTMSLSGAVPYTDENAQDAVATMLAAGTHTNIAVTYVDASNAMNLAVTGMPTQYTDELAQDAIAAMLNAGTHSNITVTYNDVGNSMSLTGSAPYTDEQAQDAVAAMLAAGTHSNIVVTYNDASNLMSLSGAAPYTDEQAQDAVAALLAAGTHSMLSVSYNDVGNSMSLSVAAAAASDIWTGTSPSKAVTPKSILDSAVPGTLTDAATVTPDFGVAFNFEWTVAGNRILSNPVNTKTGQSGVIRITQDATGSRTLTYGSNWRFPGGAVNGGLLSSGAGAIDLLAYVVGSDGKIYATLSKDFQA